VADMNRNVISMRRRIYVSVNELHVLPCIRLTSTTLYIYIFKNYACNRPWKLRGTKYIEDPTFSSPRANYTDRATVVCRQSYCQLLRIKDATWSA
jgi:hypothetical protein